MHEQKLHLESCYTPNAIKYLILQQVKHMFIPSTILSKAFYVIVWNHV